MIYLLFYKVECSVFACILNKTLFKSNSNPNKNNKVNLVEKLLKQNGTSQPSRKQFLPRFDYKKLKQMFEQQFKN